MKRKRKRKEKEIRETSSLKRGGDQGDLNP